MRRQAERRKRLGKVLVTLAVIATAVASLAFDWNESHAFNPAWAPHARFHEVAYLWFEVGIAAFVLWLLWRRSLEPRIGVVSAAWIPVLKEAAFVVAVLTPGAHFEDHSGEVPLFLGIPVNLIHPGLVALVSIVGYWLYRSAAFALPSGEPGQPCATGADQ